MIDRLISGRPTVRRAVQIAAWCGVVLSTVMLVIGLGQAFAGNSADAQTAAGAARIERPASPGVPAGQALASGGSDTAFALFPESGAVCTGDSASGGYRVQTYIVPSSVDPGTLTYNAAGPVPAGTGATLRQPMFAAVGQAPFINRSTAADTGLLIGFPAEGFSFGVFADQGSAVVPPGRYNLGFACTLASGSTLDKYWNIQIDVVADAQDVPGGFTWSVVEDVVPTSTTTTSTTSTTVAQSSTTTTTVGSSTSTTVAAGSSTTIVQSSTTVAGATSSVPNSSIAFVAISGGSPSGTSFGSPTGTLASTGSSPVGLILWGIVLLASGRMVMLISRKTQIVPVRAE